MLTSVGEVSGITAGSETRTSPYCEIVIAAYAGRSVGAGTLTDQSPHGLFWSNATSPFKSYVTPVSKVTVSLNLNVRLYKMLTFKAASAVAPA